MSFLVKSRIWVGNSPASTGGGGGEGGSDAFNGNRVITRATPGMIGVTPGGTTLGDFLNNVFYPAIAPGAQLTVDNPLREIGSTTAYTLSWLADENTNAITGITVDGVAKTPTGTDQSGTQSGNFATSTGSYTKSMSVTDGSLTGSASATAQYLPKVYWGTTTKDGSDAPILDSDIRSLAGSQLAANRQLNLSNFGGGGTYLVFAIPSAYGNPAFVINGFNNTAFTKVRSASNFVNGSGATVVMDVWVSNNLYNSPLDSVVLN